MRKIAAFLIALVVSGFVAPAMATVPTAMWVWDETNITNTTKRSAMVTDAQNEGITVVYLNAQDSVVNHKTNLNTTIQDFNNVGIDVHLLFGDWCWINPAGSAPYPMGDPCANDGTDAALAISLAADAAALAHPPQGIHYDVEAATYASVANYNITWEDGSINPAMNTLATNYINLLNNIKTQVAGTGIVVGEDMQFAYSTPMVTVGGHTHLFHHFVMDAVDYSVILSYHTTPTAIENGAAPFVSYAHTNGYPIWIGVELDPDCSCAACTYDGHGGITQMDADLGTVDAHFTGLGDTITGYAVESYTSY
jgi:hypothetical protein